MVHAKVDDREHCIDLPLLIQANHEKEFPVDTDTYF